MIMETNLRGRLRNTALPYNKGLLPLFEAVVNSIHSIEESQLSPENSGSITVKIIRDPQQVLNFEDNLVNKKLNASRDIKGFCIIDDGAGFNAENMKSFLTLDSSHKEKKGGRGVGRLLWLKAFESVNVSSVYKGDDGQLELLTFIFTADSGVSDEKRRTVSSKKKY